MPQRPLRPCCHKGCRELHRNPGSYCEVHQRDHDSQRRTAAGQYKNWYSETRWRKLRALQLMNEPLCAFCSDAGRVELATICDHIEPHAGDREKFWSGPFQSLCKPCHDATKQSQDRLLVAFYPEWLKPAQCELTIVFGPPGSGKTTYAIQHAGDEGIVIDVDMIRSQLSGLPIYASGGEWLTPAVRKRNSLLGALSKSISTQKVWFVTTGSGPMRRRWWEEKLSPKSCIVMDTPVDICMKRVREDPRRDGVRSAHLKAISEWT